VCLLDYFLSVSESCFKGKKFICSRKSVLVMAPVKLYAIHVSNRTGTRFFFLVMNKSFNILLKTYENYASLYIKKIINP
jgi:hypothetical protein